MATFDLMVPLGVEDSGELHKPYPKPASTRQIALEYAPNGHETPSVRGIDMSIGVDDDILECCNPANSQNICTSAQKRQDVVHEWLSEPTRAAGDTLEIGRIPHLGFAEAIWFQTLSVIPGLAFDIEVYDIDNNLLHTSPVGLDFALDPSATNTDGAWYLPTTQGGSFPDNYVPYSDAWSVVLNISAIDNSQFNADECGCDATKLAFWFRVSYRDSCKIRKNIHEDATSNCVPVTPVNT